MTAGRAVLQIGKVSVLLGRVVVTIGRSPDSGVVLDDPDASRLHAMVVPNGDRWALLDFKSSNGTKLNGRYVSWSALQDGDVIEIGGAKLRFCAVDDGARGEDDVIRRLRSGRLDLVTLVNPAALSPQLRAAEDERLLEVLEYHRLALDLASDDSRTLEGILARGADAARRLFSLRRQLILLEGDENQWTLALAEGFPDPDAAHAAGAAMARLLNVLGPRGWPSLERLGFRSLLGAREDILEERPVLFAAGLPFLWDGEIRGLYYVERLGGDSFHSSKTFTSFVDFLFTLTPHVRWAQRLRRSEEAEP